MRRAVQRSVTEGSAAAREVSMGRVIAFGKPAARGLPRSMCEGPAEPPRHQQGRPNKVSKQWIADLVPHGRPEPTSNPGVLAGLYNPPRSRSAWPGCSRRFARKAGSARTHLRALRFLRFDLPCFATGIDDDPGTDRRSAGAAVSKDF